MEEVSVESGGGTTLHSLCLRSKKRTRELYVESVGSGFGNGLGLGVEGEYGSGSGYEAGYKTYMTAKIDSEYGPVKDMPPPARPPPKVQPPAAPATKPSSAGKTSSAASTQKTVVTGPHAVPSSAGVSMETPEEEEVQSNPALQQVVQEMQHKNKGTPTTSHSLIAIQNAAQFSDNIQAPKSRALIIKSKIAMDKPAWHPPWKLYRVISGHLGWVRAVAVDPSNEWFATGASDRTIKIWDLATGTLKITLTGHINCVRGLAISARSPYLFSCGEDKQVKCWDLEVNKVVRHYHGHLSGVYSLALHPSIDVMITGGRDSVARVWDIRSKNAVHVLSGHDSTVSAIVSQSAEPQVATGSHDSTIKLWDLAKGSCYTTLTHHKKSVRSLVLHPSEYTMASGAPDNIKSWKFPEGKFLQNYSGHRSIVHTLAMNSDNVLVSGADNGSMYFWDWKSGYNFQKIQTVVQPGSLDAEAAIFALSFDQTGSRLISCEADKTIKIYKEDDTATEETFPIADDWRTQLENKR